MGAQKPLALGISAAVLVCLTLPLAAADSTQLVSPGAVQSAADEVARTVGSAGEGAKSEIQEQEDQLERAAAGAQAQAGSSAAKAQSYLAVLVGFALQLGLHAAGTVKDYAEGIAGWVLDGAGDLVDQLTRASNPTTYTPYKPSSTAAAAPAIDPLVIAWVAASTGILLIAGLLLRRLIAFGLIPLLSRIAHSEIYNNQARRTINEIIVAESGLCLNDVVGRTGYSRNAVSYHLFVLEKEEEIVSVKDGKYRRYFTRNGKYVNGAKNVVAALRNGTTLKLAQSVVERPGTIQRDLCVVLGSTPSATCWHAKRLLELGVIRKERVANTVKYYPGDTLAKYDLSEFGLRAAAAPAPAL